VIDAMLHTPRVAHLSAVCTELTSTEPIIGSTMMIPPFP
jgi:hypothetical protein